MSWNYRVTRQRFFEGTDRAETLYAIREVYYTDDGQPRSWTTEIIGARGDSVAECRADHALMSVAFTHPVLDITDETRPFEVPGDEDPGPEADPETHRPIGPDPNCEECGGTKMTVQGWTDKNGYSEDQYGPCAGCRAADV